jgi:hypothetical protein
MRTLVHCEGHELQIEVNNWPQLRRRMADIARCGPGLSGYHSVGEQSWSSVSGGEEFWIYWTRDFVHSARYDEEHEWWNDPVMAFRLDEDWYLLHRERFLCEAGGGYARIQAVLAQRLRIRADEIVCRPVQGPILPLVLAGVNVAHYWEVEFRAPEWDEKVTIRVIYGREHYPVTIMRRQTLPAFEKRLIDSPEASQGLRWTRTDGLDVRQEIALYGKGDSRGFAEKAKCQTVWFCSSHRPRPCASL